MLEHQEIDAQTCEKVRKYFRRHHELKTIIQEQKLVEEFSPGLQSLICLQMSERLFKQATIFRCGFTPFWASMILTLLVANRPQG